MSRDFFLRRAEIPIDVAEVRLFQYNAEIKEAVKKWSDPATREATLARCGHISDWNMAEVSDCNELFKDQAKFNDNISRWNMSNVKTMDFVFESAESFNRPISAWDVSKVESMHCMFSVATSFDQPIGN